MKRSASRARTSASAARLLVFGYGLGAGGCSSHASIEECRALLDRYVELLVREQDPRAPESTLERQKELTREKARTDASFASCPREVTTREMRCAMSAPNVDEFEKCLE
jgi:hypothetical protein